MIKVKRKWNIFQVLKEKKNQQNPFEVKIFFSNEKKIKIFLNEGRLKDYILGRLNLDE